jgi:formamidopyrimidine-DNA glycosylase
VRRRGHFLIFELLGPHEIELVAAPMQNGFFSLVEVGTAQPRDLSVAFVLADGRELRYRDALQRGKLYVIRKGCWRQVPGLTVIGVDVLDEPVFSRSLLSVLARDRRDRAKEFLLDQAVLDLVDSGYGDEILWEARVHPRSLARDLSTDELDRMYDAIVGILGSARAALNARRPPIDELPRDWFKVRGRAGEPCPRCGARLSTLRVLTDDAVFCSDCQPEKRQGMRIEWKRVAGTP